jgi:hypothetical protein
MRDISSKPDFEILRMAMDRSFEKLLHKLITKGLIELFISHVWLKLPEFIEAWSIFIGLFLGHRWHIQSN